MHYATTAVMLFRYMGIPARYAEGFSFQAQAMSGGSMEIPDENAHAWVEIFDSEKGWIQMCIRDRPYCPDASKTLVAVTLCVPDE